MPGDPTQQNTEGRIVRRVALGLCQGEQSDTTQSDTTPGVDTCATRPRISVQQDARLRVYELRTLRATVSALSVFLRWVNGFEENFNYVRKSDLSFVVCHLNRLCMPGLALADLC